MKDFVILGLAECFFRNEENQLEPVQVIEPVPSAAFLTLLQQIPSSYSSIKAFKYEDVVNAIANKISQLGFPSEAQLASDFEERLEATVRTYEQNPDAATKLPIGESLEIIQRSSHKRILNPKRSVKSTDNVKQHSHATQIL